VAANTRCVVPAARSREGKANGPLAHMADMALMALTSGSDPIRSMNLVCQAGLTLC
jgi:hypothetical protein